jgi:hypothetical protein
MQFAPGPKLDAQVWVCSKSDAFVPVTAMLPMFKVRAPLVLVSVTICEALLVSTNWLGKVTFVFERNRWNLQLDRNGRPRRRYVEPTITTLPRRSSRVDSMPRYQPTWANWNMSGPWLSQHLFEHYLFTGDEEFLRSHAYPLMRGAAEFCLAWLFDDGKGRLTTCPSESTENNFMPPDGKPAMTSAGCTMDMTFRELFANCVHASEVLKTDLEFAGKLATASKRLIPFQIGRYGQLQEWSVDFEEATPGQRHMSHMYGLYPGNQITPSATPDLAKAARVSLERRLANGGAYTGWSRAWAINFCARLEDGDAAWDSLSMLMQHNTNLNLFDTHPASEETDLSD